jgi:hypothetical protein
VDPLSSRTRKPYRDLLFPALSLGLFRLWGLDPLWFALGTLLFILAYLRFALDWEPLVPLGIALVVTLFYLTFFRRYYHYGSFGGELFGYPLYPLLAWPSGLLLLGYWTDRIARSRGLTAPAARIALGYAIFAPGLIGVEYVGYHYCGIRLASHYPPLWGIDCMHMPLTMKITYFFNGLAFLTLRTGLEELRGLLGHPAKRPSPEDA